MSRLKKISADERVHSASDGIPLMEAGQAIIAGQAGPDLVLPMLLNFDSELRIRNEGAGCGRHADVTALHRLAENIGTVETSDADHRD